MKKNKRSFLGSISRCGILAGFVLLSMAACDKKGTMPEPDPDPPGETLPYYKLLRVENMPTGTTDASAPLDSRPPVFFKLGTNEIIDAKYSKTNRWDVSFGGMFNCYISGNNGKNGTNHGFMGPGIGGITIVDKHFDQVTDIPDDSRFQTAADVFGSDAAGNYGDKTGWFLYDFSGVIVSDGRANKQHVAYALGEPLTLWNGNVVQPRTLVVKTARGDYAKIKMISCYKGLYSPDLWFMDSPFIYFTFEYVLAPAGSKKFEIK